MARQNEIACLSRLRQACSQRNEVSVVFDNAGNGLRKAIEACFPNPSANDFPDFLFDGGAVEHFCIGSSKEDKKGSLFKRKERTKEQEYQAFLDEQKERFLQSPYQAGTMKVANWKTEDDDFSYGDFLKSLERNWVKHIESLEGCEKRFQTVVFLLEQQTPRMGIYVHGGYFWKPYIFARDKKALSIIAKHKSGVRYVVYMVADAVELIDLDELPVLLAKAEDNPDIRGGRSINSRPLLLIDY